MKKTYNRTGQQPVTFASIMGEPKMRDEVLQEIRKNYRTYQKFLHMPFSYQEKLLDFLWGKRGLEIVYDPFFQHIFHPKQHPERLESFLSEYLGNPAKIKQVLPREGIHLTEKGPFVVMDIIVELSDGSIMDVEMQKRGYDFPGERSNCYVADMVMRQYNRTRTNLENNFHYKHMRPVYLIILMEHSPEQFQKATPVYIHHRNITYDSGIQLNDLENISYISLDTFHETVQTISTKLEAWLTFLSSDDPEKIIQLVSAYPEFAEYYKEVAMFRENTDNLIGTFSEALKIMDHNATMYMIDEMQKEINEKKQELNEKKQELNEKKQELDEKNQELDEQRQELDEQRQELDEKNQELANNKELLAKYEALLREHGITL